MCPNLRTQINVCRVDGPTLWWRVCFSEAGPIHSAAPESLDQIQTGTHTCYTGGYKYTLGWSHTNTHTPTWGQHTLGFRTQTGRTEFPHWTEIDRVRSLWHLRDHRVKVLLQFSLVASSCLIPDVKTFPLCFNQQIYFFFSLMPSAETTFMDSAMSHCESISEDLCPRLFHFFTFRILSSPKE